MPWGKESRKHRGRHGFGKGCQRWKRLQLKEWAQQSIQVTEKVGEVPEKWKRVS